MRADPRSRFQLFDTVAAAPLILGIRLYRALLSPLLTVLFGACCRYEPSCSSFAIHALRYHGPWRGGRLAIVRLLRCNPLGGYGYDPVPPRSISVQQGGSEEVSAGGRDHCNAASRGLSVL